MNLVIISFMDAYADLHNVPGKDAPDAPIQTEQPQPEQAPPSTGFKQATVRSQTGKGKVQTGKGKRKTKYSE